MVIKIDVQKSYEEVDIAGKIYRIELNDEKLKEYQKAFYEFRDESKKLIDKDFGEMNEKEKEEATKKNLEITKKITDLLIGAGSFDAVYNDTGRSLLIISNVIIQLIEVVDNKMKSVKQGSKNYYVGEKQIKKKK